MSPAKGKKIQALGHSGSVGSWGWRRLKGWMSGCLPRRARGDVEETCPGWAERVPEGCLESPQRSPLPPCLPLFSLVVFSGGNKRGSKGFPLCKNLHPRSTLGHLMGNSPPNPPTKHPFPSL